MFWLWFWFNRAQDNREGGTIQPASFRQLVSALCTLCFVTLGMVIMFAIILFFIFFPNVGSYDEFYPLDTINCYISSVSDSDGYKVILISENDATVLTAPVTKERYQEMQYLAQHEDPTTLYCLNTYRSGTYDMFISTYDDQSTEEAWEDYKQAIQDNSIHRNTPVIVLCSIMALVFLAFFIGLLVHLIKQIGNHKRTRAIEAGVAKEQGASEEKVSDTKGSENTGLPPIGSTPGLPPMGTSDVPSPEPAPPVEIPVPEVPSSALPTFEDEFSDEIDAFDPGNVSWHK